LETLVSEVFHDETGLALFGAADDVVELDDVGMVEHFVDDVFTFDFVGLDGKQHFDSHISPVFFIVGFEDMGVLAPAEFLIDGIIIDLAE
jgi:hypothetical protein